MWPHTQMPVHTHRAAQPATQARTNTKAKQSQMSFRFYLLILPQPREVKELAHYLTDYFSFLYFYTSILFLASLDCKSRSLI